MHSSEAQMIRHLTSDEYKPWTAADLLDRLGDIPLYRIRTRPEPGTATEEDLLEVMNRKEPMCELIDGILVEKDMGSYESFLAMELGRMIGNFAEPKKLGSSSAKKVPIACHKSKFGCPMYPLCRASGSNWHS
jgi:hypothetical protein